MGAQPGGVGLVAYSRKEGRARGEVTKFLVYNARKRQVGGDTADQYFARTECVAGVQDMRFQELMPRIGVSNDFFIRTSDPEHGAKVQEVLTRVKDNGHVYEGVYEGWYCPRCADFKTDAEAGEDHTCPIHRIPLTREKEDNYFFRLSAFQADLERLYDEQPDFVMPRHRYNEAR